MGRDDVGDGELLCHRGDGRHVHCMLKTSRPAEDDWRSHYEQRKKPRRSQIGSALDHMALSMWESPDDLIALNEQFERKLGDFIAVVELSGEEGIWFAETGPEGHHNVWGRPAALQRLCLAIHPV